MTAIIGAALQLIIMIVGPIVKYSNASEESKRCWLEFVKARQADRAGSVRLADAASAQDADLAARLAEALKAKESAAQGKPGA